jgi:hypothetical protein
MKSWLRNLVGDDTDRMREFIEEIVEEAIDEKLKKSDREIAEVINLMSHWVGEVQTLLPRIIKLDRNLGRLVEGVINGARLQLDEKWQNLDGRVAENSRTEGVSA